MRKVNVDFRYFDAHSDYGRLPPAGAQWGAIQSGVDAAKKAKEAGQQPQQQQQQQGPATKAYEGSASMSDYQNRGIHPRL